MNFDELDFIPRISLEQQREEVKQVLLPVFDGDFHEVHDAPLDLRRSEALETLGILEFYSANYRDALKALESSLTYHNTWERRGSHRIAIVKLLIALAQYRTGEADKAIKGLQTVASECEAQGHRDLACLALSDQAVASSRLAKHSEAVHLAREAIDISQKLNRRSSFEHLQFVRVLYSIFIRANEFDKADALVDENEFSVNEKKLLQAGIFFASGNMQKASVTLDESEVVGSSSSANSVDSGDAQPDLPQTRIERELEQIMISFNSVALHGGYYGDLAVPLKLIESFVNALYARKHRIDKTKSENDEHNPFSKRPWNESPTFLSLEFFLFPVVVWSSLLVAETESRLIRHLFPSALRIERGDIVHIENEQDMPVEGDDDGFLKRLVELHQTAVGILEACHSPKPASSPSDNDEANSMRENSQLSFESKSLAPDGEAPQNEEAEDVLTAASSLLTSEEPDEAALTDIAIAKDYTNSVRLFSRLNSNDFINPSVSAAALKILRKHKIEIDPNTAQFVVSSSTSKSPTRKRKTRKAPGAASSSVDLTNNAGTPGASPKTVGKKTASAEKSHRKDSPGKSHRAISSPDKGKRGVADPAVPDVETSSKISTALSSANQPAAASQTPYVPSSVDKFSLKAELLPYLDHFGRDEVAAFIQWCIANVNGVSIGFMGWSVAQASDIPSFVEKERADSAPSDEFLREVRNRMTEIDTKLSLTLHAGFTEIYFQVYGNDSLDHLLPSQAHDFIEKEQSHPFPHGLLESHIVVLMLLVKLSTQLLMKEEAGVHLRQFQRMSTILHGRKPTSLHAQVYYALGVRFQMDYLEWVLDPAVLTNEKELVLFTFTQILPLAKRYRDCTKALSDLQLRRDAFKRLINVFISIHKDSLKEMSAASSVISSHSVTMSDLAQLSPSSIEHYEETDLEWVKRFGKLRAMQCMSEMKSLSSKSVL